MRKILLPLLLLLAPALASAAITNGDSAAVGFISGNIGTVVANNACAVGDLIEVKFLLFNAVGPNVPPVVNDNVNSGNYTIISTAIDSPNDWEYGKAYIVCNASGTPTITVTSNASDFSGMEITFDRWTAFSGTPTLDSGATAANNGNSGTAAGSFVGTQSNELVIANGFSGNAMTVSGSWTALSRAGAIVANVYQIVSTATTTPFAATLTSAPWDTMMTGYYGASSGCTHKFWDQSGNWSIPNGSTGSYWNMATGNWSTPDCSTGHFWRQDGASAAN